MPQSQSSTRNMKQDRDAFVFSLPSAECLYIASHEDQAQLNHPLHRVLCHLHPSAHGDAMPKRQFSRKKVLKKS